MRRSREFLFIVFLFVVAAVIGAGTCYFIRQKAAPPPVEETETVKELIFTPDAGLGEMEQKLIAKRDTDYSLAELDGKNCVKAVSMDSASALYYKDENLDHTRNPFVSWEWKAEKFPSWRESESLEKKKEFDFVAQFYVIFYSRFFLKTKAIQYVWTENIPVGTVTSSPYTDNVKIMVLESGPAEGWKREMRNVNEDFYNLFGEELDKDVVAIAFMTDSDSTASSAEAYYGDISLGYLKTPDEEEAREAVEEKAPEEAGKEEAPEEIKEQVEEVTEKVDLTNTRKIDKFDLADVF